MKYVNQLNKEEIIKIFDISIKSRVKNIKFSPIEKDEDGLDTLPIELDEFWGMSVEDVPQEDWMPMTFYLYDFSMPYSKTGMDTHDHRPFYTFMEERFGDEYKNDLYEHFKKAVSGVI